MQYFFHRHISKIVDAASSKAWEAWQVPVYEHYFHWKTMQVNVYCPVDLSFVVFLSHLEALNNDWSGLCSKRPLIDMVMCMTVLK